MGCIIRNTRSIFLKFEELVYVCVCAHVCVVGTHVNIHLYVGTYEYSHMLEKFRKCVREETGECLRIHTVH